MQLVGVLIYLAEITPVEPEESNSSVGNKLTVAEGFEKVLSATFIACIKFGPTLLSQPLIIAHSYKGVCHV